MVAAVALGVRDLVRVAEDRHSQPGRRSAVVGVAVAEHHARQASKPFGGLGGILGHRLGAGVELEHPAVVLDEVHVHRPAQIPGVAPHAVGDPLGRGRERVARHGA